MKNWKFLGILALAALMVFAFAACDNSTTPSPGPGPGPVGGCDLCDDDCDCDGKPCNCEHGLVAAPTTNIPPPAITADDYDLFDGINDWGVGNNQLIKGEKVTLSGMDVYNVTDNWNPVNTHQWTEVQFFRSNDGPYLDASGATHLVFDMMADACATDEHNTVGSLIHDIQNMNVVLRTKDGDNNWVEFAIDGIRGLFGTKNWPKNEWFTVEVPIYKAASAGEENRDNVMDEIRAIFIKIESVGFVPAPRHKNFYFANIRFETQQLPDEAVLPVKKPNPAPAGSLAFAPNGPDNWYSGNGHAIKDQAYEVEGVKMWSFFDNIEAGQWTELQFFLPGAMAGTAGNNIAGHTHFAFDIAAESMDGTDQESLFLRLQELQVRIRSTDESGGAWGGFNKVNLRHGTSADGNGLDNDVGSGGWTNTGRADPWVTLSIPITGTPNEQDNWNAALTNRVRAIFIRIMGNDSKPISGKRIFISNMRFEGAGEEEVGIPFTPTEGISADDNKWEVLNSAGPEYVFKKTFAASGSSDLWTYIRFHRGNDNPGNPDASDATHFVFEVKSSVQFDLWNSFQNLRIRFRPSDGKGGSVDYAYPGDFRGVFGDAGWAGNAWITIAVPLSSPVEDGHNAAVALADVRHVGIRIELNDEHKNAGDNESLSIRKMRFETREVPPSGPQAGDGSSVTNNLGSDKDSKAMSIIGFGTEGGKGAFGVENSAYFIHYRAPERAEFEMKFANDGGNLYDLTENEYFEFDITAESYDMLAWIDNIQLTFRAGNPIGDWRGIDFNGNNFAAQFAALGGSSGFTPGTTWVKVRVPITEADRSDGTAYATRMPEVSQFQLKIAFGGTAANTAEKIYIKNFTFGTN